MLNPSLPDLNLVTDYKLVSLLLAMQCISYLDTGWISMKYTESTLLRLPPGTLEKLREVAEREGSKPAEIMRRAIRQALSEKCEAATPQ